MRCGPRSVSSRLSTSYRGSCLIRPFSAKYVLRMERPPLTGFSADAARLVRIIDKSPRFSGAALTAAITPDANRAQGSLYDQLPGAGRSGVEIASQSPEPVVIAGLTRNKIPDVALFVAFNIAAVLLVVVLVIAPVLTHFSERSENISESSAQLRRFENILYRANADSASDVQDG